MGETKEDLIVQCLTESQANYKSRKILQKDILDFFCARCRNDGCVRAGHGETAWIQRMSTQVERFFGTDMTDPNLPQYRDLLNKEFSDMTQHAMRLIVSSQKGDWEVPAPSTFVAGPAEPPKPPGPEYDPEEIAAATAGMPPSPEEFFRDSGEDGFEDVPFGGDAEDDAPFGGAAETIDTGDEPLYPDFVGNLTDSTPVPAPSIRAQTAKPQGAPPRTGNVDRRSGIMLGGAEPPPPGEPEVDPWAVPEHLAPGATKINVGGSFTFGGAPPKDKK